LPALRYQFDEGSGELTANTGWASDADLRLGSSPDGLHFFATASSATFQYTAPAWAPSNLPLNGSAALGNAPVVRTYLPGSRTNISLFVAASTPMVRITQLPAHGELLLEGTAISAGATMPRSTVLTFSTAHNSSMVPSAFAFTAVSDGAAANGTFHLVPESPPRVVRDPAVCRWPLGTNAQYECHECQSLLPLNSMFPCVLQDLCGAALLGLQSPRERTRPPCSCSSADRPMAPMQPPLSSHACQEAEPSTSS
jgi:hypothetical protein